MKRIVSLLFIFVSVFCYADSVQQGCVKTRGRMIDGKHVPGQGLPGSIVSIKDRTAIGVKNSNGTFSFPVTDNQFRVDSVKKKDYVLLDADATSKIYTHTADTLFFVMETPEQILQDKLATERRLRRSLQAKLQAREEELDSLIALQKISQEEYQQGLQQLYAEQSENDKLISDMAERYSTLDYDQMDEFYRQVSYYIEQCEFVRVDSLLKSRGDLQAQLEAARQQGKVIQQEEDVLQQAKNVHQHDVDELAKRCYSYYENFKMQHQHDSAAYYLEQRVQLDPTNAQWLEDLAFVLYRYLAQYSKALEYVEQTLVLNKQRYGESHLSVANSYNNIGVIYGALGDHELALKYIQLSFNITREVVDGYHPDLAMAYNNMGQSYEKIGDYVSALEYYQQARTIIYKEYRLDTESLILTYAGMGRIFSYQHAYKQAFKYATWALEIAKEHYGEVDPTVADMCSNIGALYDRTGNYNRALDYFQQAFEIRKQVLGSKHPDTKNVQKNIETIIQKMNEAK